VYEHGVLDAHGNETARVLPSLPIHLYLADDRLACHCPAIGRQ
jgi:hypothetical protein